MKGYNCEKYTIGEYQTVEKLTDEMSLR